MLELSVPPPPYQSQPRTGQTVQNVSDFLLFSASHEKLVEKLKNPEIESTSHVKINKGKI